MKIQPYCQRTNQKTYCQRTKVETTNLMKIQPYCQRTQAFQILPLNMNAQILLVSEIRRFFSSFFSGNLDLKKFTKFWDSQWLQIWPLNFSRGPLSFRDDAFKMGYKKFNSSKLPTL